MNLPPGLHVSRTDRSIGGVLSAVGSLLQALGGERGEPEPPSPAAIEAPAPMTLTSATMTLPSSAIPPTRAHSADPADEVSALLADARTRAQAIMDESMARAEELLRPAAEPPEQQTLERIRRTVADIATDVRGLHSRLDDIEALVRAQSTARAPIAAPPAPVPAPAFGTVRAAEPTWERSTFGSPPTPTPPPAVPTAVAPPPRPPELSEMAPPPSLLPTSWAGLPAPPPTPVAPDPPAAPTPAPEPPAQGDAFNPVAGAVSLRVSPVAGFQGLMRVQDALVRIRGVREAGVEAYAQGEARLRLHFSSEMDAASLASALTELLGRPTRVAASSTSERTLQLVLE